MQPVRKSIVAASCDRSAELLRPFSCREFYRFYFASASQRKHIGGAFESRAPTAERTAGIAADLAFAKANSKSILFRGAILDF
jgi:hypothetical protein